MQSLIQTIATVVGALSLLVATVAYLLSQKNLNFNVMIACIERYQKLLPALKDPQEVLHDDTLRYMDLCNEELFYFQHKYLRDEVALEWIEGMTKHLPIFNSRTALPWEGQRFLRASDKLVRQFPRVMNAFTASEQPELSSASSRRRVAEQVLQRAREYRY